MTETKTAAMRFTRPVATRFGALVVVSELEIRSTRRPRWLRWLCCWMARWLLSQSHELIAHHTVVRLREGLLVDPWARSEH